MCSNAPVFACISLSYPLLLSHSILLCLIRSSFALGAEEAEAIHNSGNFSAFLFRPLCSSQRPPQIPCLTPQPTPTPNQQPPSQDRLLGSCTTFCPPAPWDPSAQGHLPLPAQQSLCPTEASRAVVLSSEPQFQNWTLGDFCSFP